MSAFASGTAEAAAELKKRIADMRAKCDRERIPVGYTHAEERDRFSDTAEMIVAGGNYEGRGYEITFV